jgi:hypothetical protein
MNRSTIARTTSVYPIEPTTLAAYVGDLACVTASQVRLDARFATFETGGGRWLVSDSGAGFLRPALTDRPVFFAAYIQQGSTLPPLASYVPVGVDELAAFPTGGPLPLADFVAATGYRRWERALDQPEPRPGDDPNLSRDVRLYVASVLCETVAWLDLQDALAIVDEVADDFRCNGGHPAINHWDLLGIFTAMQIERLSLPCQDELF